MDSNLKYQKLHTQLSTLEHPRVLLNILSHGNEILGKKVSEKIEKLPIIKGSITIHLANEAAYKENKRFISKDLNRSFPGDIHGEYEERLAYEMSEYIKHFDYLLDIHSTVSGLEDTLIIEDYFEDVEKMVAACTNARYLLHMEATKGKSIFTATRLAHKIIPSLAFEYGGNDDITAEKTYNDIVNILKKLGIVGGDSKERSYTVEYFNCYAVYPKKTGDMLVSGIQNYSLVKRGQEVVRTEAGEVEVAEEDFYPVLFGESNYKDFFGFKAKKLN